MYSQQVAAQKRLIICQFFSPESESDRRGVDPERCKLQDLSTTSFTRILNGFAIAIAAEQYPLFSKQYFTRIPIDLLFVMSYTLSYAVMGGPALR
jgi:hypothetical protein